MESLLEHLNSNLMIITLESSGIITVLLVIFWVHCESLIRDWSEEEIAHLTKDRIQRRKKIKSIAGWFAVITFIFFITSFVSWFYLISQ